MPLGRNSELELLERGDPFCNKTVFFALEQMGKYFLHMNRCIQDIFRIINFNFCLFQKVYRYVPIEFMINKHGAFGLGNATALDKRGNPYQNCRKTLVL